MSPIKLLKTDKEMIGVKSTKQITESSLQIENLEHKYFNKSTIYVMPKTIANSSVLKRKSSKVEPITTVDDHPLDLSVKTNNPLYEALSRKMIKVEPSDKIDGQPLDLTVKRKKLVLENNFTVSKDDQLTNEDNCKLIKTQTSSVSNELENNERLTINKIDAVSVKKPEVIEISAENENNQSWKVLGKPYYHHVFVSVS